MTWNLDVNVNDAEGVMVGSLERRLEAKNPRGKLSKWIDVYTDMWFMEKSRRKKPGAVRSLEKYVREDLPCGLANCLLCDDALPSPSTTTRSRRRSSSSSGSLSSAGLFAPLVLVPDALGLIQCVELVQEPLVRDQVDVVVVLQSVLQEVLGFMPSRDSSQLRGFLQQERERWHVLHGDGRDDSSTASSSSGGKCRVVFFADQHFQPTLHCTKTNAPAKAMEPLNQRYKSALRSSVHWYQNHLQQLMSTRSKANTKGNSSKPRIVCMTNDEALLSEWKASESGGSQSVVGVEAMDCAHFVRNHLPLLDEITRDELVEVAVSTSELVLQWKEQPESHVGDFQTHLTPGEMETRLATKTNDVFRGKFQVNTHNPLEAFVKVSDVTGDGMGDEKKVFVPGGKLMNRAIHGDEVVVELLPKHSWLAPKSERFLVHYATENLDDKRSLKSSLQLGGTDGEEPFSVENAGSIDAGATVFPTGRVVGILRRNPRKYIATIISSTVAPQDDFALAIPMDIRIPKIRVRSQRMEALVDQRLQVVIDDWPIDSMYPHGHYVGVLGKNGQLGTEMSALLAEHEIEEARFCEAALACLPDCDIEANCIAECSTAKRPALCKLLDWKVPAEEELPEAERRDLRTTHRVFSVDPPGCQDIDDAMSVRSLPNGNIELGVHIADVSYFVKHESALDHEARHRGTTVYLVGQRLDMLPAVLSADVCSLHEKRDRLAVSVLWELDRDTLQVIESKTWFGRTIIRSCAAMTYDQAHALLQGMRPDNAFQSFGKQLPVVNEGVAGRPIDLELQNPLRQDLLLLRQISRRLAQARGEQGGLDLSRKEELRFALSVSELGRGEVEINVKESLEIHHVIAELMILANTSVAKQIVNVFPESALLRRHAPPSGSRFAQLQKLAEAKGIHIDTRSNLTFQQSLDQAARQDGVDEETMALLRSLAVRVMTEAEYICASDAVAFEGQDIKVAEFSRFAHYGLGLDFYTHFTSPIRRYADVIVHRQLLRSIQTRKPLQEMQRNQTTSSVAALPASSVISVLDEIDEDAFLDDLVAGVESNLMVSDAPDASHGYPAVSSEAQEELVDESAPKIKPLFPPKQLVPLANHLNRKHRNAKNAARDCDELFLALYFASHTVETNAIIMALKQNGFLVFIPQYDLRVPVYLRDKDGNVQMDPLLCGLRLVDSRPATGLFAKHDAIRLLPAMEIILDEESELLQVVSEREEEDQIGCEFRILDEIRVQISCDLTLSSARLPQLQVLLVGKSRSSSMMSGRVPGSKRESLMAMRNQSSIREVRRVVYEADQVAKVDSNNLAKPDHHLTRSACEKTCGMFYQHTITSKKLPQQQQLNLYDVVVQLQSKLLNGVPQLDQEQGQSKQAHAKNWKPKKSSEPLKQVWGPGRIVFGNYERAVHQKYNTTLASYLSTRSSELEQAMSTKMTTCESLGGASGNDLASMQRMQREALVRTQKLANEKRHDRINRRNKHN